MNNLKKYENGEEIELSDEEMSEFEREQKKAEAQEKHTPISREELLDKLIRANVNGLNVDDSEAYRMKAFYPAWETLSETSYCADKAGYKFTYQGDLYKTVSANHTFATYWVPGEGTESLYTRIDETHDGTEFDPIPYSENMMLENGKYYTQGGVIYLCNRSSETPTYHSLNYLTGIYVELADENN